MPDDIISQLLCRGLLHVVEDILFYTSALTLAACLRVCRLWHDQLTGSRVWRSLFVQTFNRQRPFRELCRHNGWSDLLPATGKTTDEAAYRRILYKSTCFRELWCRDRMSTAKLYTGHLVACLKLFRGLLFAGMLDGQIKIWRLQDPVRNEKAFRVLEGHEERVTCLDAAEDSLVSASMDRSIRVWSIASGGLIRVLRGVGAPLLQIKLTAAPGLISLSLTGQLTFWSWCGGPLRIERLHETSLEPGGLAASADVILDDVYIAVVRNSSLVLYSSLDGRRYRAFLK
jgi:WD40 repeat protein